MLSRPISTFRRLQDLLLERTLQRSLIKIFSRAVASLSQRTRPALSSAVLGTIATLVRYGFLQELRVPRLGFLQEALLSPRKGHPIRHPLPHRVRHPSLPWP